MRVYGNTDIGRMRDFNQDAFENMVLSEKAVLSVVCDGMGGANAGDVASKMAAELITEYVKKSYTEGMDGFTIEKLLRGAVSTANIEIYDLSVKKEEYTGMGTTVVAALIVDDTAHIVHVGDSRAYLINDEITQITRDHSVVQSLIEKGELTKDEARVYPHKNVITRAVGTKEEIQCDYNEVDISGSKLLICTDGLSGMLTDEEILSAVNTVADEEVTRKLIELANSKVSADNITVTFISER